MNKPDQSSAEMDLLVELGCEELPPKTLQNLARSFFESTCKSLIAAGMNVDINKGEVYYTPRRLAFKIKDVSTRQEDQVIARRGPTVSAAFGDDGNPTPAAMGFARSVGKEVADLDRETSEKGEWLSCTIKKDGKALSEVLFPALEKALSNLPVAKPMRWSDHDYSFVRPVHWLLVLHGTETLEGSLFGKNAGRDTLGHRVHSPGPHSITSADTYVQQMEKSFVLVDPTVRKQKIEQLAIKAGQDLGAKTRITPSLLNEVSNIVEWPTAVVGNFDEIFLEVPQEALVASMEDHQKFFPVLQSDSGELTSAFVVIANIESQDFAAVKRGFERVIRPRLADAQFFWHQDQKKALEGYSESLNAIVFQKDLGTVGDKSRRIEDISSKLAEVIGAPKENVQRAALLCKCDLVTQMVGEFPELQGIMGGYYAAKSGEADEVTRAISEHYYPRFSGDDLPTTIEGQIVSVSDRMDTLVGIFAAGLKPTGNKDPFALRRAALGVTRILVEAELPIGFDQLLDFTIATVSDQITVSDENRIDARNFLLDRLKYHFLEQGHDANVVNATLSSNITNLFDLQSRLKALGQFMLLSEAERLVAANKRIGNILKKSEIADNSVIDESKLVIDEERQLFADVSETELRLLPLFELANYDAALKLLAGLDGVIAAFFDHVMVMDEDIDVRNNRLALLQKLKGLFDRIADLALAT